MRKNHYSKFIFLTIITIGTILLLASANTTSMWGDEVFTVLKCQETPHQILQMLSVKKEDYFPPLSFFLLHYWMELVDHNDFGIRLSSVIISVLGLLIFFKLGDFLFNRKIALLSTYLAVISPHFILYLPQARYYAVSGLFLITATYAFIRAIKGIGKSSYCWWGVYIISSSLLIYTHYLLTAVLCLCQIFFIFTQKKPLYHLMYWVIAQILVVLLFLPWISVPLSFLSVSGGGINLKEILSDGMIKSFYMFFSLHCGGTILPWDFWITIPVGICAILVIFFGVFYLRKDRERLNFILLFALLSIPLSAILMIIASNRSFISFPRIVAGLGFFYYILMSIGIYAIMKTYKKIGIGLIAIITLTNLISLGYFYTCRAEKFNNPVYVIPWREVTMEISRISTKNDMVIYDDLPFRYYYKDRYKGNAVIFETRPELKEIKLFIENNHPRKIWVVETGRDTSPNWLSTEFYQWIDTHGYRLKKRSPYCKVADSTRKIKEKIYKKEIYEYKLILYLYESR